eukprot:scaffold10472_cov38-Phaeocystis_antarctica.AAC.1
MAARAVVEAGCSCARVHGEAARATFDQVVGTAATALDPRPLGREVAETARRFVPARILAVAGSRADVGLDGAHVVRRPHLLLRPRLRRQRVEQAGERAAAAGAKRGAQPHRVPRSPSPWPRPNPAASLALALALALTLALALALTRCLYEPAVLGLARAIVRHCGVGALPSVATKPVTDPFCD